MKLSIMIPSTYDRKTMTMDLVRYIETLCKPYEDEIEIKVGWDNKEVSIGVKRELLYGIARGEYVWQIDSDDSVAPDSISKIMEAIKQKPDCITFKERCIMNGQLYSSNHSLKYDDWCEKFDGYDYCRTPFMKSVIKTSIAQSVCVPDMRYGEDHAWARLIKPLLKTEVHIDDYLYYYEHTSSDHHTRYGFDKDNGREN